MVGFLYLGAALWGVGGLIEAFAKAPDNSDIDFLISAVFLTGGVIAEKVEGLRR